MAIKVVPLESVPEVEKVHPRVGKFRVRRLLRGVDGTPGNFTLELSRTFADFYSPRHRHNFDQVRYQIEGTFDFDRDGRSPPGTVIYHPESAPYGPQKSSEEALVLVLQFGGASGCGYISSEQQAAAIAELSRTGEFKEGAFVRTLPGREIVKRDAFEAVWEHVNGRPIEYAPPRYRGPIVMRPENYGWVPAESPGTHRKLLGIFTERGTEIGFLRLDPGARHRLTGETIYFVTAGSGSLDGSPLRLHTTVHVGR
jgi:hypothetical protein